MKNFINYLITAGFCLAVLGCKKSNLPAPSEAAVNFVVAGAGLKTAAAPTGTGTQWYVAANGLSSNNGLSPGAPKNSIREVADQTSPGDVVNIMSTGGEFKRIGTQGAIMATTKSGAQDSTLPTGVTPWGVQGLLYVVTVCLVRLIL